MLLKHRLKYDLFILLILIIYTATLYNWLAIFTNEMLIIGYFYVSRILQGTTLTITVNQYLLFNFKWGMYHFN